MSWYNLGMPDQIQQKPAIIYDDFSKLDIRVGTVVEATTLDWSKKLLKFTVDLGPSGKKTVFSGVRAWYVPEDFLNKQFCFLINLEPKKMGDEISEGMMLMADTPDGNLDDTAKPTLIPLQTPVPNGTMIR